MHTSTVREAGPLLDYLFKTLTDTKKTRVRQCLKFGSVLVNDKVITQFNYPLAPGDKVTVRSARESRPAFAPAFGVEVIFEDDAIIVVKKPAGLLTISTETVATQTVFFAVNEYVCAKDANLLARQRRDPGKTFRKKQIFVVHRLDREASGLLVFAKNLEVKMALQSKWKEGTKKYYALVEGILEKPSGTIRSFLRENKFLKVYSSSRSDDAKLSTTRYQLLRTSQELSLLEVTLETGRKHQIRVHLSDLGHPIVGDDRYGSKMHFLGDGIALHAYHLEFTHPMTGQNMVFNSVLPVSFERMLQRTVYP